LRDLGLGPTISRIDVPYLVRTEQLPTVENWNKTTIARILAGGEAAARLRLSRFLDRAIREYETKRNLPGDEGTSRLSQDLRFGLLSIREVLRDCLTVAAQSKSVGCKRSVAMFINELVWRDFYFQVLWHWPNVLEEEFQQDYRTLGWRAHWRPGDDRAWGREPKARQDFVAWCEGQTGFPIVDAGMRQLAATGFMHNRVRMIVAMFLTKELRIWWMHGESHFMRLLLDGEIASNNGGWQWSASTGTDAAPFFRIQNPWLQTKRYDPEGNYVRHWVPELTDVPAAKFFGPPRDGQSIGKGYPLPMVDHASARELALEMFKARR
jgi:deoxyribodipyrimidine photo-lyase